MHATYVAEINKKRFFTHGTSRRSYSTRLRTPHKICSTHEPCSHRAFGDVQKRTRICFDIMHRQTCSAGNPKSRKLSNSAAQPRLMCGECHAKCPASEDVLRNKHQSRHVSCGAQFHACSWQIRPKPLLQDMEAFKKSLLASAVHCMIVMHLHSHCNTERKLCPG